MRERFGKAWAKVRDYFPSVRDFLIYLPVHFLLYELANKIYPLEKCFPVSCGLDEILGLHPWAVFPYCSWFFCVAFMLLWKLFTDREGLSRACKYCMVTSATALPVLFLFPCTMPLRPDSLKVTGLATWLLDHIYQVDRSSAIMPSFHVMWAFMLLFAAWNDRTFRRPLWRLFWAVQTFLICLSTALTKQHSVLDAVFAVPFILFAYLLSFGVRKEKEPSAG